LVILSASNTCFVKSHVVWRVLFASADRCAVNERSSFGKRADYDGSFAKYCSTLSRTKSAVVTGSGRLPRSAIARLSRLRVLELRSCKHSSKAAEPEAQREGDDVAHPEA
jgi:hypothetical protein